MEGHFFVLNTDSDNELKNFDPEKKFYYDAEFSLCNDMKIFKPCFSYYLWT